MALTFGPAAQAAGDGEPRGQPYGVAPTTVYQAGGRYGLGLALAIKAGVGFPQPFSELGFTPLGELEVGWVPPLMGRGLEIFAAGTFSWATADGVEAPDLQLDEGSPESWDVTVLGGIITLGARYRVPLEPDWLRPYLALGGRLYILDSEADGKLAGRDFGTYAEKLTQVGVLFAGGLEVLLDASAILVEVQYGSSPLDGDVLHDTTTGSLNLTLGYRIFL